MSIGRNEVNTFQFASVSSTSADIVYAIGTAASDVFVRKFFVTDLKASGGAAKSTLKIYSQNYEGAGEVKPLEFDIGSTSVLDLSWELPYRMIITGTSGENRSIVASASANDIKYVISGYFD